MKSTLRNGPLLLNYVKITSYEMQMATGRHFLNPPSFKEYGGAHRNHDGGHKTKQTLKYSVDDFIKQ